jgi:pimeloyl-ACP methyl ester carboxylesterase
MSTSVTTGTVVTAGADIYFERRGSGPGLLVISGGGGDAGNYSDLADSLADEYTVLTYDRRGNSRSRLRADPTKLRVEEQSADARAVLDHNGIGSASVFGSSGGAVIGLDLAARSPHTVELLVAHEPPVISVLDDADRWFAFFGELDSPAQPVWDRARPPGSPSERARAHRPAPPCPSCCASRTPQTAPWSAITVRTVNRGLPPVRIPRPRPLSAPAPLHPQGRVECPGVDGLGRFPDT